MRFNKRLTQFCFIAAMAPILTATSLCALATPSNGLAPEVTDLNAEDSSFKLEKKLPYLTKAFINSSPESLEDGIVTGTLGSDGGDGKAVLAFVQEIVDNHHGNTDSLLISYKSKLLFESYFKRGRIDFPHYQMSITKSYTALAIGRAMQLGYLSMADLNRPVVSFFKDINQENLAKGTKEITLHQAMHMNSGIRIDNNKVKQALQRPENFKGQGQVQLYLELSQAISNNSKKFKYQASDPTLAMQVLEAVVPGSAETFIKTELLGKMAINNYAWQQDLSGLPKAAAGASLRSRDMLKMGMLVMQKGKWKNQQLIPVNFIEQATSAIDVNRFRSYGYFWWGHEVKVAGQKVRCISGRGAGGQFIMMFPEQELIIVSTAHNKGMGKMLKAAPKALLPAFNAEL